LLLVLFLNACLGLLTYQLISTLIVKWEDLIQDPVILIFIFIFLIQLFVISLLHRDCRFIIVKDDCLVFISLLFPFYKKRIYWKDIDKIKFASEISSAGAFPCIWLIKDNKLKYRISSFYYLNYQEISSSIKIKKSGRISSNPFKQILYMFGKSIPE
jgi:hypothetical protein